MPKKKTLEEFIKEAREIHGDKYDYSLVEYKRNKEIIQIICPKHSVFRLTPFSHTVNKNGCRKCYGEAVSLRQTTPSEDVLDKCNKKFNFKYSYNVVHYRTLKDSKVEVTCPIHGPEEQSFANHLNSITGCPDCSISRRTEKRSKPQEEKEALQEFGSFVKSEVTFKNKSLKYFNIFKENFGNLYSYSKVSFIENTKDTIQVYCNKHKVCFKQLVGTHLKGHSSCEQCISESIRAKRTKPLEYFIKKAKEFHGDKYGYHTITNYINSEEKVKIWCNSCQKTFDLTLADHVNNKVGCSSCAYIKNGLNKRLSLEEVLKRFKVMHGDKYSYYFVSYTTQKDKVDIVCPKHGIFPQAPVDHWRGDGCRLCGYEKLASKESNKVSKEELEFFSRIDFKNYKKEHTVFLPEMRGFGFDLYIPELKLALEYNGEAFHHSSKDVNVFYDNTAKDSNYHYTKYLVAKESNIKLLHVFSFEGLDKWVELINNYISSPDKYNITFDNLLRVVKIDKHELDYYGLSTIKLVEGN